MKEKVFLMTIALLGVLFLSGCNQQKCAYYKEVEICEDVYKIYHIPINYTDNLNIYAEMGYTKDVVIKIVEDSNITEPYIEPQESNEYYCGRIEKRLVCMQWI